MDPAIRPVERDSVLRPAPARRQREGDGQPFELERELARRERRPAPAEDEPAADLERPVGSDPVEDEAGSHLDLFA